MNENKAVVERFYKAFQRLDYRAMQDCYSEYPVFSDQVFGMLEGDEVKVMWEMLCMQAKDFSLVYGDIIEIDEEYITCKWTATYTFSRTGRKVVNAIKAHMRIQNGKITEHSDQFSLKKWARQALGVPGILFGWMGWMKARIRKQARGGLERYMQKMYGTIAP